MVLAFTAALFMALAVFTFFRVAQGTVQAELAGVKPPVGWLRWLVYHAAGILLGMGIAIMAMLLVAYAAPGRPVAKESLRFLVLLGWFTGVLAYGLIVARLRSRAGLPGRELFAPPGDGKWNDPAPETVLPLDIQNALRRLHGLEAANPAFWFGFALLPTALVRGCDLITAWRWHIAAIGLAIIIIGVWVWNRLMMPRWRVWALEHVDDIELLEAAAIGWLLLLSPHRPLGRWMLKSEFWTPALRRKALVLGRGRGGPAWRGEA